MMETEAIDRYLRSGGKVMIYMDEEGNIQHMLLGRCNEIYGSVSGVLEAFLLAYPKGDLRNHALRYLARRKQTNL